MIGEVGRFLVFNLGASLVVGLLVAAGVLAISGLLGVRDARSRSWLLGAALIKSTLVLLGLSAVLPLPVGANTTLSVQGLPFSTVAPFAFVWIGAVVGLRATAVSLLDRNIEPSDQSGQEAERAHRSVRAIVERARALDSVGGPLNRCRVSANLPVPAMRVTRGRGPMTVDPTGSPTIALPSDLLRTLDDGELDAIVGHEIGHVLIARDRGGCVPLWARVARWTSPSALLIGSLLDREEELACDELSVALTGKPAALASALLRTHRRQRVGYQPLVPAAHLLDRGPLLRQRIRLLTAPATEIAPSAGLRMSIACAATILLAVLA